MKLIRNIIIASSILLATATAAQAGYYTQWSTHYVPECSYQYVFTGYGYVYQWACF